MSISHNQCVTPLTNFYFPIDIFLKSFHTCFITKETVFGLIVLKLIFIWLTFTVIKKALFTFKISTLILNMVDQVSNETIIFRSKNLIYNIIDITLSNVNLKTSVCNWMVMSGCPIIANNVHVCNSIMVSKAKILHFNSSSKIWNLSSPRGSE